MFGYEFYNESVKKYTAIFGTIFNDIVISRKNELGVIEKRFKVPIDYAPYQKFLVKLKQDPDLNRPVAITLPRMSYEITAIEYDAENKVGNHGWRNRTGSAAQYTPVPYNIQFSLYILTKYIEDGNKIVEQILPFFRPEWTSTVQFFPEEPNILLDVPLILNSVTTEDAYEGSFEERRVTMWTLTFTMKAKFFGPVFPRKLIKFVKVNTWATDAEHADATPDSIIRVQPGLDINGNPTTDINSTIPYLQINRDDDWAYIVQITDETGS